MVGFFFRMLIFQILTHTFPLTYSPVTTNSYLSCHIRWRVECGVVVRKRCSATWEVGCGTQLWCQHLELGQGQESEVGRHCHPSRPHTSVRPQQVGLFSATMATAFPLPEGMILWDEALTGAMGAALPPSHLKDGERNGFLLLLALGATRVRLGFKIHAHWVLVHGVPGWLFPLRFKLAENKNVFIMIYPFRLSLSFHL